MVYLDTTSDAIRKLRCLQKVDNKKVTLKQQVNLNNLTSKPK